MNEPVHQARTKRSEKRQRQEYLIARCKPEEKAAACERARERGLSVSDFIRALVTGTRPLRLANQVDRHTEAVILLKAELNKIGTNVNQVAKVANASGTVSAEQVRSLLNELGKCYAKLQKVAAR